MALLDLDKEDSSGDQPGRPKSGLMNPKYLDPLGLGIRKLTGSSANDFYDPLHLGLFGKKKKFVSGGLNNLGIDRNSRNYSDLTEAAITRSNWDYSRGQLTPLLDRMKFDYNNTGALGEVTQDAANRVDAAFDNSLAAYNRDAASTGVTLQPDQQVSLQKQSANARGLAQVGAMTQAARNNEQNRNQIALG